jgi:energy-coupling factor transporter ATP-binding protein EcfA2
VELFAIKHLNFAYPEQVKNAISDFSLSVRPGEFLVVCGPSGCGKSTLLRQLKTVLAPHGRRSGQILFDGKNLDELSQREQAEKIGFVQQSPENQIVTDKVWHELAFGLESLGYDTPTIRRRVAEMASFFGIQTWFYKSVTELSGGQKQLLNLASVMVLQPKVLILDEPTSQLDPIAASDFLATLGKINRELGTTIILTEHRLEEAFSFASRVAVMDGGRMLCSGTPADVGAELKSSGNAMFLAMPAAMRIWAATDSKAICPISVCDGRNWLLEYAKTHELKPIPEENKNAPDTETVVSAREIWFKYDKDLPDVVKGLSLELHKGEFLALLGGNGTGKTTTLKLLASLKKPYRGELNITGSVGMLPQNPQTLFVKATVREDLLEIIPKSERKPERLAQVVSLCKLAELLDRHPYDLSGGEQQRAALAKILLLNPDILLLDEPTKGLDAEFKQTFGQILRTLRASGVAILMVSHDIEFCAKYAERCALFFDGNIVTEAAPRTFFSGNSFYTTSANRIARDVLPEAVTPEDVIAACGGAVAPEPALPEYQRIPPAPEKEAQVLKKLPVWRKALAAVSGIVSLVLMIQAIGMTDLTKLVDAGGLTGLAGSQMRLYGILLLSLLVFALSIGRNRPPGLSHPDARGKAEAKEPHDFCDGFDPPAHSADAVHRCVLLRRETVLFHFAAHSARMYAAVLPHLRGAKAAGTGAGADCRARCTECGRPRRVLHAAGIQTGRGNDDPGGRGLWRRNGILSRRDDHAGFEYAVFPRPVDTVADVRDGVNRLAGGSFVPQGRPAAVEAQSVHLRRDRLYRDLRRYYESRVRAHVVRNDQLEDHHELLHHRHSGRSGTCSRYVRLSLARRGADAGKAGQGQNKIRLSGVTSAKPCAFSCQCPAALGMS